MSAQVAADLRAAADVLERDGWTQGQYHDDDGCHCAMGAIVVVVAGEPIDADIDLDENHRPRYDRALDSLQCWIDERIGIEAAIPEWNDDSGRTADEVIAALRAAADAVEQADTHRADGQR